MKPTGTMKHGSHHVHDGMLNMWHHIDQHLHSRHFWTGVGVTLLIIGFVAVFYTLSRHAPILAPNPYPHGFPYTPFVP